MGFVGVGNSTATEGEAEEEIVVWVIVIDVFAVSPCNSSCFLASGRSSTCASSAIEFLTSISSFTASCNSTSSGDVGTID